MRSGVVLWCECVRLLAPVFPQGGRSRSSGWCTSSRSWRAAIQAAHPLPTCYPHRTHTYPTLHPTCYPPTTRHTPTHRPLRTASRITHHAPSSSPIIAHSLIHSLFLPPCHQIGIVLAYWIAAASPNMDVANAVLPACAQCPWAAFTPPRTPSRPAQDSFGAFVRESATFNANNANTQHSPSIRRRHHPALLRRVHPRF